MLINKTKKLLHTKKAELMSSALTPSVAGSNIAYCKSSLIPDHDDVYFFTAANVMHKYNADNDAWYLGPAPASAGAFTTGACSVFRALGCPSGNQTLTATGGSTTTINTNLTLVTSIANRYIYVVDGAGSGYIGTVKSNTMGANSVITLKTPSGTAFTATTKFQLVTGSVWYFVGGTTAVGFQVYDVATETWTTRSVTNLPTAWNTGGTLISTSPKDGGLSSGVFATTCTGAPTTTNLPFTSVTIRASAWINYQVRFTSGVNNGLVREITGTAGNSVNINSTTSAAAAGDTFVVEGNDDNLYLMGNNAVTLYKYKISTNTWSTITPVAARGGAYTTEATSYIDDVKDVAWNDGTSPVHIANTVSIYKQNGRYIYSFRSGNTLDVYDIAANTWIAGLWYRNRSEGLYNYSSSVIVDGCMYINLTTSGRINKFDIDKNEMTGYVISPVPAGSGLVGNKLFIQRYTDTGTVDFLYQLNHSQINLLRWVMI